MCFLFSDMHGSQHWQSCYRTLLGRSNPSCSKLRIYRRNCIYLPFVYNDASSLVSLAGKRGSLCSQFHSCILVGLSILSCSRHHVFHKIHIFLPSFYKVSSNRLVFLGLPTLHCLYYPVKALHFLGLPVTTLRCLGPPAIALHYLDPLDIRVRTQMRK